MPKVKDCAENMGDRHTMCAVTRHYEATYSSADEWLRVLGADTELLNHKSSCQMIRIIKVVRSMFKRLDRT